MPQYINTDILSSMKPVAWVGSAKRDFVACAPDVRRVAGRELERVQRGAEATDWEAMASIGRGAREIRVHVDGELRVVYWRRFPRPSTCCTSLKRKPARPRCATSRSASSGINRCGKEGGRYEEAPTGTARDRHEGQCLF